LPTLLALAKFAATPAIWMSHGRVDWFDTPPKSPRIYRYVVVDETRRRLLTQKHGVPEKSILLLPNGVDLDRIPARPAGLPERPERAVSFSGKTAHLATLQIACSRAGIKLDALGVGVGRLTPNPEELLVKYDVAFATGRSALEALCCGCAVIVGDFRGLAGMVTEANFRALRSINFGSDGLIREMNAPNIDAALRLYDRRSAEAVVQRARTEADVTSVVDQLERLYREAIAQTASDTKWTDMDQREVELFLAQWPVRPLKMGQTAAQDWVRERHYLSALAKRNKQHIN
jgi:glycosyltransferase involved in cell wall biosynthesis